MTSSATERELDLRAGRVRAAADDMLALAVALNWFPAALFVAGSAVDAARGTARVFWRSRYFGVDADAAWNGRRWTWCVAECRYALDAADATRAFRPRVLTCVATSPTAPVVGDDCDVCVFEMVCAAGTWERDDERKGVASAGAAVRALRAIQDGAMRPGGARLIAPPGDGALRAVGLSGLPEARPDASPPPSPRTEEFYPVDAEVADSDDLFPLYAEEAPLF